MLRSAYLSSIQAFNEKGLPLCDEHRTERGTVGLIERLELTSAGLVVTAWLTDDRVISKVRNGTVRSFSIGAWVHQSTLDEGTDTRCINELRLREISVCRSPADPGAKFDIARDQRPYSNDRRGSVALAYAEERAAELRKELAAISFGATRAECEKMLQLLDAPVPPKGEIAALQNELRVIEDARGRAWAAAILSAK